MAKRKKVISSNLPVIKSVLGADGFPRRNRLDLNTPAEKAIFYAMQEVEKAGCDKKLTEAIILLGKAKDCVGDYVDANAPKTVL